MELLLMERSDARLERADFVDDEADGVAKQIAKRRDVMSSNR
jgi:hypothetical protein